MPPGQDDYSTLASTYSVVSSPYITGTDSSVTDYHTWSTTTRPTNVYSDYRQTLQDYSDSFLNLDISSAGISLGDNIEKKIEDIVEKKLKELFGKRAYMLGLIKLDTGDYDGD